MTTVSQTGRPRSRRGEGDQLRTEILDAVNRLLDEWGSDEKLTMRAVAKQVGVAAPSIYLHFSDKTELVWAALSDKYEQLAERMHTAEQAAEPGQPRERLRAQIHAYCRFAVDNPGHYRLMYEIRQPAADSTRIGHHPARLISGLFRTTLTDCAQAGYPLSLPLRQTAHTLWTGLHGILSICHSLAITTPPDQLDGITDGLLDILVDTDPTDGQTIPPDTKIERFIADTIVED
ncbi:TetR/AcrR family transcriptional regulator [Sciscionella marina]|uniref:TetR/AcrR family transcriptional regulator n=1 Tax=Sciscionella marina TaxID=508770 RepID=UPI00036FA967|nr:TetR/AcrR family transcriptional regulator [Sciscionella marina]